MGSPISPVFSEIFLQTLESEIVLGHPDILFYKRYVDDVYAVIKSSSKQDILASLNGFHPNIQFTCESEQDNQLPFLDVLAIRKDDGSIRRRVYRKSTHTGRYLNFGSYHHKSHKISVIDSLMYRAFIISDPEYLDEELLHIMRNLSSNGYPKHLIKHRIAVMKKRVHDPKVEESKIRIILPFVGSLTSTLTSYIGKKLSCNFGFIPGQKIKNQICSYKDKPPPEDIGVYKIKCSCNQCYYGETRRSLKIRKKEHLQQTKLKDPSSAVAIHMVANPSHNMGLDSASLIVREERNFFRKFLEGLYIRKAASSNIHLMNRDTGMDINPLWSTLLLPLINNP